MRQTILDSVHDGEEVEAFLDELECIGAEGWENHLSCSMHAAGQQHGYETMMASIDKALEKLEKRKQQLNQEVKKLNREVDEPQQENEELRGSLMADAEHNSRGITADILDLDRLQHDLDSLLVQLSDLETCDGDLNEARPEIRGGMGGQLEDEEHVYSYAKYKNWDEVDQELAAASATASKAQTDTKASSAGGPGSIPNGHCSGDAHQRSQEGDGALGPSGIHMVYLNERFTVDCGADNHVFETPIIVCHFPSGGACNNDTWKNIVLNHLKKYGHGNEATCLFKVEDDHTVRQAIARLGLLNEGSWAPEGQGETYIVTDQSLMPPCQTPVEEQEPTMRGGGRDEILTTIQAPSDTYADLAEEFDRIYDQLVRNMLEACRKERPSACIMAWISVAGILRMRNTYLERQLEDFKEMHDSIVEDLKWNMNSLARLEENLDTAEEGKTDALMELGLLKKSMERKDERGQYKGKETEAERPANPTPNQGASRISKVPVSPAVKESAMASSVKLSADRTLVMYFYFYPLRSVIVLPGGPARILQFPQGTKLHDVREILAHQHDNGLETDTCAARVREIIEIRDRMGIDLPESLLDDVVLVGIPESHLAHSMSDNTVRIAAWETLDSDDYVEFVPRAQDNRRLTPVRSMPQRTKDDRFIQLAHIINSFDYRPGTGNEELADSVCSCSLCAADAVFDSTTEMKSPLVVSVRGGGDPYDDDDDDDDDDGYDSPDSDDEDEVDHEDEANDPWEEKMTSDQDWDALLTGISWKPEGADMPSDKEQQLHLRGGAGNTRRRWRRQEEYVRSVRESAPSPTRPPLAPPHTGLAFYDSNGHFREDDWRAYYDSVKNNPGTFPCRKNRDSEFPCSLILSLGSSLQVNSLSLLNSGGGNEGRLCASVTDQDDEARAKNSLKHQRSVPNVSPASISPVSIQANRQRSWCRRCIEFLRALLVYFKHVLQQVKPKAAPILRAGMLVPTPPRKRSAETHGMSRVFKVTRADDSQPPPPRRKDTPPIPARSLLRQDYVPEYTGQSARGEALCSSEGSAGQTIDYCSHAGPSDTTKGALALARWSDELRQKELNEYDGMLLAH